MLIKEYEGHKPNLHPTVRVAENATIVGKATLAEDVNVWVFNAAFPVRLVDGKVRDHAA